MAQNVKKLQDLTGSSCAEHSKEWVHQSKLRASGGLLAVLNYCSLYNEIMELRKDLIWMVKMKISSWS